MKILKIVLDIILRIVCVFLSYPYVSGFIFSLEPGHNPFYYLVFASPGFALLITPLIPYHFYKKLFVGLCVFLLGLFGIIGLALFLYADITAGGIKLIMYSRIIAIGLLVYFFSKFIKYRKQIQQS